eukprot:gene10820-biopygen21345
MPTTLLWPVRCRHVQNATKSLRRGSQNSGMRGKRYAARSAPGTGAGCPRLCCGRCVAVVYRGFEE